MFVDDVELNAQACQLLYILSQDSENTIVEEGGIPLILSLLKSQNKDNEETLLLSISVLANVTSYRIIFVVFVFLFIII